MNNERLEELIYKFQFKLLNAQEKEEFENILKLSADARKIFHDWNIVNQALDSLSIHKERIVIPIENTGESFVKSTVLHRIVSIAAILTLPLLVATILLFVNKQEDMSICYNEISCTKASVVSVSLSDGSIVHLYSGSTLRYPSHFDEDVRTVNLVGEATFEVQSDLERPFYVETVDKSKVKAYGTKFNVCSYEKDSVTSVFLEHGAVDFESPNLKDAVIIKPNTRVDYIRTTNKYTVSAESADKYLAREQGILLFQKTPLKEIITTLSRVYDINIDLQDEELADYPFTASFKDESIYQIMNMLKKSSPDLKWVKVEHANKIIIMRN